ncbi:hypothetical protein ACFXKI_34520 [Streptomyces mirabilis]|uniref:hypothetical protein n=1 Tax=Streptomyces mirabilis TaxID=68239 RepID=UPI0036C7B516
MPLASNADRTRLMAVHGARSPGGALHALRRRLDALLPIDVLSTHYPNRHGQILLNVALGHTADRALRRDAAVVGQRPQDVLRRRATAALTREEQERARQLENRLENLLAHHTPDEVLACVAGLRYGRQHHPTRTAP